ncbi:MAG: Rid family hydrolase [Bryobacteraceae bacterium]|nr:Rid family hydrolase [Bryobacteraceae bacterium]
MRWRRIWSGAVLLVVVWVSLAPLEAQRRKKGDEEPPTQVLEQLPDPPAVVVTESQRLAFHVAPMSGKGLLSRQVRDALREVVRLARGNAIVKLRAFVAGTGDVRRVQTIVSEEFAERRISLPALTVVQVGALPMEGAQVLMEAVSADRKAVNPGGLAFIAGQVASSADAPAKVGALVQKSVGQIKTALAGVGAKEVLRVTCFLSSLDDHSASVQAVAAEFPQAPATFVQLQRIPLSPLSECEAVARLSEAPGQAVKLENPQGLASSPNYSQVALAAPGRIAMTGGQMAFGTKEEDVRLAFQRLEKTLDSVRTSSRQVFMTNYYPLSQRAAEMIRKVRFEFVDQARPPASTLLLFEGLPSLDASLAIEVVAVVPMPQAASSD